MEALESENNLHTNTILGDVTYYIHDHLGNTRVTYTPKVTCKLNEDKTYSADISFSLEGVFDYYPYGKILRQYIAGEEEKYLTTQHQRDEETGLDYRGARYYDSDIARFLSLDPWSDKFLNWSPYNYVLSNPIKFIDPNGKGPGDAFATVEEAAIDWAKTYNDNSIEDNREYGSVLYKIVNEKGEAHYSYTVPNVSKSGETVSINYGDTKSKDRVADIHSHGAYDIDMDATNDNSRLSDHKDGNNEFSSGSGGNGGGGGGDEDLAIKNGYPSYMANPAGELRLFDPMRHDNGQYDIIPTSLPSDPQSPSRKNDNGYANYPKNEPANYPKDHPKYVKPEKGSR